MKKYTERNEESEKLENFLSYIDDIFDTSVIPLVFGIVICILFVYMGTTAEHTLKVALNIVGYVCLLLSVIKTISNYD